LLKTRLQVLTQEISPHEALENYRRAHEVAATNEQFSWTGVKDRFRVHSYFDPFGKFIG